MSSSDGNTITGNTMEYNDHGIWFMASHNNEISQNIITYNSFMGIVTHDSENNIITNNIITNNNEFGLYLLESCYNKITENRVNENRYIGIELYFYCNHNTISKLFMTACKCKKQNKMI